MNDAQIRLNQMIAKLRERDCRITPQRRAVLKVLAASKGHPAVIEIYDQIRVDFPTTSLATVYKTLNLLKEMGQVLELSLGEGGSRYEGAHPDPHPHLICVSCGEIQDVDIAVLQSVSDQVMQETGYQIVNHRLDFFGRCPACQAKQTNQTP